MIVGTIKVGWKYIVIYVACTKADSEKIDPSAIVMNVYQVSESAGTEAAISGSPFTMVKKQSKTGWFGYALDISALTAGQYTILVEATVDGIDTHWTDSFFISDEMKKIADFLDALISSRASATDMTFIKDMIGGRWLIENNQMKFYKDDNVTLVATFDLKNSNGDPSMKDVFEREVFTP